MARQGEAGTARHGGVRRVKEIEARQARSGGAGLVLARRGWARQAWPGADWRGEVRCGGAGMARRVEA